ncbi:glycoside hydrolase family 3 N-terminal domain-containing protein [Thermogemmatispora tikiterensis]|uniref:beta-glucosidase n=1 Tax=Thermogemmatispora tikiterensis TaxID=1825093 RepID=A0A328VAD7_9CHLR|nr:glycoside hydrolase family 3 N-terminal domain-containing protein [Thermogemmatispora tikiterensis]RAQ94577.1 beta-glucosidase [Thermogemmatispora tikiterensis]
MSRDEYAGQVQQRIDALLASMTLEEKAGQLTQYFYFPGFTLQTSFVEEEIRSGKVGSLLFVADPVQVNRLQRLAVEESRLSIPLLFGFDVIHGLRTIFPVPLGLAASWDPQLVEQVQTVAAREARAVGIHWAFAPMVDIARDPRWGRIVEGAGEDPYLGACLAAAHVRGFQGEGIGAAERIAAGPKHFVGYGAALGGRDYDEVNLSESELRNVYLPPFAAAVEAGAENIMSSYVGINGVPAAADRRLLTEVLRNELGFQGFVVSDANAVIDLTTHGLTRDDRDAALRALQAGLDMEMSLGVQFGGETGPAARPAAFSTLPEAVRAGQIEERLLDEAVRRVLALKFRLGLFEHPYVDETRASMVLSSPAHRELARVAAERSAVLLRNTGILPLDRAALRRLAVIGPLAADKRATLGPWVFVPELERTVTVLEGLRQMAGSTVQIDYAPGVPLPTRPIPSPFAALDQLVADASLSGEPSLDERAEFERAIALARSADVAVLVLGEAADMSGEAASRSTLDLPGRQLELLEAVAETGTPLVLVLLCGRPLDLRRVVERTAALLVAWHPGSEGGNAVARLLFGEATPGGKLPVTWPRSVGQVPLIYAHLRSHQPQTSGLRYWEEESTPLYPFGFGLSYGEVEYSDLQLSATSIGLHDTLEASVVLHNRSQRPLEEVAQLYLHQRYGRAARPVRELKAFERVSLAPGERRTLRFTIGPEARRYWSAAAGAYVLDESVFDVWVGGSSQASLHAEFTVQTDSQVGR